MKVRICAVLLSLVAGSLQAAELCDGVCSISFDFSAGGSISASNGATITFGPGGSLVLGTDGAITPGPGGSVTPDTGDMSSGGSVVLGSGGGIQFGEGGSLATADSGGISVPADSALDVTGPRAVSIDSGAGVHVGSVTTAGNMTVDAGGSVADADGSSAINLLMAPGDAGSDIAVTAAGDVSWMDIQREVASISLVAGGAMTFADAGSQNVFAESAYTPGSSHVAAACGNPGATSSTFNYWQEPDGYSGDWSCAPSSSSGASGGFGYSTMLLPSVAPAPVASTPSGGGGALGWPALLLLAGAAGLRRRMAA